MFAVIKKSLWDIGTPAADQATYDELKIHTIAALANPALPSLNLPPELYETWKKYVLYQVKRYYYFLYAQSSLPLSVPYVILKGTSAAQYYPHPEFRTMGDIDLMTRREDYQAACDMLLANGYTEMQETEEDKDRHRSFSRGDIVVEMHIFFASLNDPRQAKYVDDLIIDHINPSHVLPDMVNGLVLLEHISQHLELGLGLRQIIDWMMFVDRCLPDEKWPEFREMAEKSGMETLAVTAARMCVMYLGLPERKWCAEADEAICNKLMDYVLTSGNFGNKWKSESEYAIQLLTYSRTPKGAFKILQRNGLINWKAAQNRLFLRPFAWIYRMGYYLVKGLARPKAFSKLKAEFDEANKRSTLFDALGVKQKWKGLVVYKNGEYKKK